MTPEQTKRAHALKRMISEAHATDYGRGLREYFELMLGDFREGNDTAVGELVYRNQGAIAFCLQVLQDLTPMPGTVMKRRTEELSARSIAAPYPGA